LKKIFAYVYASLSLVFLALILWTCGGGGGGGGPLPTPPVAGFSASPTTGMAPLTVAFSDQSTGVISTWSWVFGDGGTSTEQNPSHTYAEGTYTVELTVTGPDGSDTNTKVDYIAVGPLAGTSDVLEFFNGDQIGWARANVSIDGSGNIFINNYTDSDDNILSDFDIQTKWVVDGSGTIREYDTSVDPNVINPYLYGHLASNNHFAVATDSDSTPPATYSLLVARKRDASVTFGDGDIRGKSFTYHQFNGNVWTYGFGSIDSQGSVTLDSAFDPSGELPGYPQVNITTLSVDSAGIVTNSPQNDFYGWLLPDKNTIFALIDNPGEYQFVAIQFLGDTYVQADLAGTWRFNTLYGLNPPGWLKGTWTIDAVGTGTYDPTSLLNDLLQVPVFAPEQLNLAANGIITNQATPSYHGMLSAGRDLYVRTRSHGTPPVRYSIAIAVK